MLKTVNLKEGMPTLEEARQRLSSALAAARREKCPAVKLVHGYGSSGVGGALREGIRASLRKRRKKGEIRAFIAGENWSIFDETTQQFLEENPSVTRDGDLDRGNEGITIAIL
jgi:dsDNA-specific endonuclease/ATPase MutS2